MPRGVLKIQLEPNSKKEARKRAWLHICPDERQDREPLIA